MAKDKFNETANAVSSRSRGGNKTLLKPKETDGAGAGAPMEKKIFTEKIKRLFNILEDNNAKFYYMLDLLINLIKKKINKRLHKI